MMPIRDYLQKYIRVLQIMKKPSREEFVAAAKVTGIGALLMGLIGYVIYIIMVAIGAV
ncbi:MAG: protein translocase SEC61 complex subunit gamma [Nanoarchaeota archaeon]|nr:protein translocase SEC61 complex subunit gamma [Nanoarchaeota archaeon]MBU4451812.1 protein translocase SEC61 complex subunit gamma [Nanoarchaeota archaeon]